MTNYQYTVYSKEWDLVQECDTSEEAKELVQYLLKHYPDASAYYRIEREIITHEFDPRGV